MYAVTGITGKVGSTVAHHLLAAGRKVRAVVSEAFPGGIVTESFTAHVIAAQRDARGQSTRRGA